MIKVEAVPAFNDNYIWLIIQTDNKHVAIVDPGDATPVLEKLNSDNLIPCAILITHHHRDHVGGVLQLLQNYSIPVYGPGNENIPGRTQTLSEGDTVNLDDLKIQFRVIEMPGHTAGAIAYFGHEMVFVGDTLFMAGCGRLFEGTPAQMYGSLARLAGLPDETLVYCAHEYTQANLKFALAVEPGNQDIKTRIQESKILRDRNIPTVPGSIAIEKKTNPFLRTHVSEVIEAASLRNNKKLTAEADVFAVIRKWKDNF